MGKGKAREVPVAVQKAMEKARRAMQLAAAKLPIKTKFATRFAQERAS